MEFEILGKKFDLFTEERQYEKFREYVDEYVLKPSMLIMLLVTIAFIVLLICIKKNADLYDRVKRTTPFVYMGWLVSFYVLDRTKAGHSVKLTLDSWLHMEDKLHESRIITSVLNVVIFLVFAVIVQYYWNNRIRNVLIVVIVGLLIEEAQFIVGVGDASVSDMLAYVIGGILGNLMCRKQYEKLE